jgi:hypothetical protein
MQNNIRVCTKLHKYVIQKSKEAGSNYGTVGLFEIDVIDPCCFEIEQLQGDGPNGNSAFGFLATQSNFDKLIFFQLLKFTAPL